MSTSPAFTRVCLAFALSALLPLASITRASAPAPATDQQNFEIRFMTDMIDHHAMAVMMAELCLERAIHPELIAACEEMRDTQLEEIVTMQTWLHDWYGIHHEPEMNAGMENQMRKLAATTGTEFEIEFMKSMIRHHWTAIIQARQCQPRAYHAELIAMGEEIEAMQQAEIAEMGAWLCSWYQICNYHVSGA